MVAGSGSFVAVFLVAVMFLYEYWTLLPPEKAMPGTPRPMTGISMLDRQDYTEELTDCGICRAHGT